CTKCSKTFSRARDLQRHIRSVHTGHKMNKCEICGCSFTRMDSLLRHQRNKTCNNINARS
ncbi:KOX 5 protein, partial [Phascolomyces articulosus]